MDFALYNEQRGNLIKKDTSLRRDYALGTHLSEIEHKVDEVVRRIRQEEAKTVWNSERDETSSELAFLKSKDLITETKIFKILRKMPKGALLHAHFGATVNPRWILDQVYKYPHAYSIRLPKESGSNLLSTDRNLNTILLDFSASCSISPVASDDIQSISDDKYELGSWINLARARENFSLTLGGREGFDRWLLSLMSISRKDAHETYNTVSKIWVKFVGAIATLDDLIAYEPVWIAVTLEFLRNCIEDNVLWVEERLGFPCDVFHESSRQPMSPTEILTVLDQTLTSFKEGLKTQGKEAEFIGYKIVFTALRTRTHEELETLMRLCIQLKKDFPHIIAGFDLVGPENTGYPLLHYAELLLNFKHAQAKEGVDIPYLFHAGETVGDGTDSDQNLYDALLLGSKRIGHGFSLIKHPELVKLCRERNICVEMCPISNEVLRLTTSMSMHPLPALYNSGVPIALSSDDPAVFGNLALSFDFFQVLVGSEISGLLTMADIARDSIKYSLMNEDEKAKASKNYEKKWEEFAQWVLSEHGDFL
ncbi:Metallo-dependent hydrolase [Flagelloscypha sp. PMI_526]|nr:Metallo-dependent hydrolase [Flagelloscypha sp. PMI_526]